MKTGSRIFWRLLDRVFDCPAVSLFQRLSGHAPMVDGLTIGGVTAVRDGVVSIFAVDTGTGGIVLVDAGYDRSGRAILMELSKRGAGPEAVKAVLLTHGHIDHIGAAGLFPGARVMALSEDLELAEGRARSKGLLSGLLPKNPAGVKVTDRLSDSDRFRIGDLEIRVFSIPGHTPGSAAYLVGDALFLGDSAFAGRSGAMLKASWPFTDDMNECRRSLVDLAGRLKREGAAVRTIFFAHSAPLEKGLDPLLEFAAENTRGCDEKA